MPAVIRYFVVYCLLVAASSAQSVIHLKTRDIETDQAQIISEIDAGAGHLLLLFREHPTAATVRVLQRRGIKVLGDVPDNGLLVSIARRTNVAGLRVHYAAAIRARDKLSPLLASVTKGYFLVEFHRDTDMNRARGTLLNLGLIPIGNPDLAPHQLLLHLDSKAALRALASLDEVAYVFPASRELASGIPAPHYAEPLTVNGPVPQSVPTYGDGWDGPGLGAATLAYVFSKLPTRFDSATAQSEIRRAMAEWSKVIQIGWQPATNSLGTKTVNILFAAGAHGDSYPFDGLSGILSHTFYPAPPNPEPVAGDMHFDDSESWHAGANTDLFSVALHELGHALGLGHSDDPTAVMYPYYRMVTTLADPDKTAILTLYAAQTSTTVPPPSGSPLTLTMNGVASTTTASSVDLSGSAAGGAGTIVVTWTSSGGGSGAAAGSASAWTIFHIPLMMGTNIITVEAMAGGSLTSKVVSITRQLATSDTTAPALTIASPSTATLVTTSASITIAGSASDSIAVVQVSWATNFGTSGVASGTTAWSAAIPLLLGNNTVTVRATDAAGNIGWRSVMIARR